MITQALTDNGFEVDFRTTLDKLEEHLSTTLPDLLILDIEVNGKSCLDILPDIRTQDPKLPVIIASSHTDGTEIIRSYDAGTNHYIKKPYDITELVFQVRSLLQQSEKQTVAIWEIGNYQIDTAKHLLIYPDKKRKAYPLKSFRFCRNYIPTKDKLSHANNYSKKYGGMIRATKA
ncbi:DNA-binding response regulator [Parabacteroides sp. AF48-14]|nr:DNA-binding response regulator [Parabacteroides sp. AF48-14]